MSIDVPFSFLLHLHNRKHNRMALEFDEVAMLPEDGDSAAATKRLLPQSSWTQRGPVASSEGKRLRFRDGTEI
jgi:hypothetical protein